MLHRLGFDRLFNRRGLDKVVEFTMLHLWPFDRFALDRGVVRMTLHRISWYVYFWCAAPIFGLIAAIGLYYGLSSRSFVALIVVAALCCVVGHSRRQPRLLAGVNRWLADFWLGLTFLAVAAIALTLGVTGNRAWLVYGVIFLLLGLKFFAVNGPGRPRD